MLTPDQLAAIKTTMDNVVCECGHTASEHDNDPVECVGCFACACFSSRGKVILIDYARLTRHNQRMSAALEMLANGNWQVEIRDNPWDMGGGEIYIWSGDNPQQLAERALVEDE